MSYLTTQKNLYSIISNEVIDYIKNNYSQNNQVKKYAKNGNIYLEKINDSKPYHTSIPQSMVNTNFIDIDCGNNDNGDNCTSCLMKFGITQDQLKNYSDNIKNITSIQNNECSGVCSCNITNVSLSTHLIFTTSVSINSADIDSKKIYNNVRTSLTTVNKSESTSQNYNWMLALAGAPLGLIGAGIGALSTWENPTITKDIEEKIKSIILNLTMFYSQTINQIIINNQDLVVKGTGIKVHNISIDSLNDIVFTASITNCSDNNCVASDINDVANYVMNQIQDNISGEVIGLFKNAYNQNKSMIFTSIGFIILMIFLWLFLIIKKASSG
jgi:hypothetical protein